MMQREWSFDPVYCGKLPKDKIAGILQDSDYFVHPSEFETFSVVTAEALMTGTPAIVANNTALPELVTRKMDSW